MTHGCALQFTPTTLAQANLVDPSISVTPGDNMTFTLSAPGGVAAFAWLDHPAGTVGYFQDNTTGVPSNGFFLIPGITRTGECLSSPLLRARWSTRLTHRLVVQFVQNLALSKVADPDPADFVVRSVWNNTHL